MTLPERDVVVRQVPQTCGGKQGKMFLRELADAIAGRIRPCVVLDCSRIFRADKELVHLLLCCLEEAMKRNGDVRLAAVHPDVRPVFDSMGLGRLFVTFASTAEAAHSYRRPPAFSGVTAIGSRGSADQPAANAA